MARKGKRQKKKDPGKALLLSPDEETRLNAILKNPKDIDPPHIKDQLSSPGLAQALVERIPVDDPEIIPLILEIGRAFDVKNVRKAVKRTLFKFRQRGLAIPEMGQGKAGPILIRRERETEPEAYLGAIDPVGSRGIFIILPRFPKGVDVGMGIVSDEKGILEFLFGRYSKKQMKEVRDLFFKRFNPMVMTSLSHAATILEESYKLNKQAPKAPSSNYLQIRPSLLENITLLARPVIYDLVPPENIPEGSLKLSQIEKLIGHELMESWVIDPEDIRPLVEEILRAEQSPIFISREQKANHIKGIKEKGLENIFTDSKRLALKGRLEEMAYVFFKMNEEEYVRLSLAAACSLAEKDTFLRPNLFLKTVMERTLDLYLKTIKGIDETGEAEEGTSSSTIIIR